MNNHDTLKSSKSKIDTTISTAAELKNGGSYRASNSVEI
jgi:hypothetical protein